MKTITGVCRIRQTSIPLARLRLDALRSVDDDDDRIDGRERAVGVLCEVLVAGGVENIDLASRVFEAHHGRGHRNASLALDLHEVGRGALLDLVALDGSGHVDRAAEEQQFLREGWSCPRRGGR